MDLTPEIRLDIYNLLFPPNRSVNIVPQKTHRKRKCSCGPKNCTHHPLTLFINQESRAETLKHYRSFVRDRLKNGKRVGGDVIYYRPGKDQLYIEWQKIQGTDTSGRYCWVESLRDHNQPGFLEGITLLEVRNCILTDRAKSFILEHQVRLLPFLRGLQTLHLHRFGTYYYWPHFQNSADTEESDYFKGLRLADGKHDGAWKNVEIITTKALNPKSSGFGRWF
jgi:hypothetical protein